MYIHMYVTYTQMYTRTLAYIKICLTMIHSRVIIMITYKTRRRM